MMRPRRAGPRSTQRRRSAASRPLRHRSGRRNRVRSPQLPLHSIPNRLVPPLDTAQTAWKGRLYFLYSSPRRRECRPQACKREQQQGKQRVPDAVSTPLAMRGPHRRILVQRRRALHTRPMRLVIVVVLLLLASLRPLQAATPCVPVEVEAPLRLPRPSAKTTTPGCVDYRRVPRSAGDGC